MINLPNIVLVFATGLMISVGFMDRSEPLLVIVVHFDLVLVLLTVIIHELRKRK